MVCTGYREIYRKDITDDNDKVIKNDAFLFCNFVGKSTKLPTNTSEYSDQEFVIEPNTVDGFPEMKNISLAPGSTYYETDTGETKHLGIDFIWGV